MRSYLPATWRQDFKLENPTPQALGALNDCLKDSPFQEPLTLAAWVEFSDVAIEKQQDQLLGSWLDKPRLGFATALLFAGAILDQRLNGEAVQLSTVESYGRERDADYHS